ncbi:hypothetical protein SAMN04488137_0649 [Fictibacillus solisalsi]|uniref:Uncharacterized protein n=1 Tax=Fictibacillus solisalsi TaxID=459525 RepID=A0A1G9U298_9BACL|nr:hypothetical protein [Fictibacillus solisalsi]SDM54038.1 hypothetical protein SAMN04488137_0649 [Fictibacillus solisalsi]
MKHDQLYKVWIWLFVSTIIIGLLTVWIDTPWIKKGLWGVLVLFSLAASITIFRKSEKRSKVIDIKEIKKEK